MKPIDLDLFDPSITVREISDFFFNLGIGLAVRVRPIDPFLKDAWQRKTDNERGVKP